jgi:hypothetical protein
LHSGSRVSSQYTNKQSIKCISYLSGAAYTYQTARKISYLLIPICISRCFSPDCSNLSNTFLIVLTNLSNDIAVKYLTMINLPAPSAPRGVAGTLFPSTKHLFRKLWLHVNHTEMMFKITMFPHYMLFPISRSSIRRLGKAPGCRPAKRLSNGVVAELSSSPSSISLEGLRKFVVHLTMACAALNRAPSSRRSRVPRASCSARAVRLFRSAVHGGGARSRNRYPIQDNYL